MRLMIGLISVLGACTDTPTDQGGSDQTDGVSTAETGRKGGTDTNVKPCDNPTFDGNVTDASGAPVALATIKFCQATCLYADTDSSGDFTIECVPPGANAYEVVPPAGTTLATGYTPIVIEAATDRTGDMVLPTLDAAQAVPSASTELELGSGLFVTLSDDELEPPLFVDDAKQVAGVLLDPKQYPPLDFDGGEVIAIWYLDPFEHHAKAGLPIEIANQWKLPVGETLEVWQGIYSTIEWVKEGELTVQKSGRLTGTARIHELTTTMLVRPPAKAK